MHRAAYDKMVSIHDVVKFMEKVTHETNLNSLAYRKAAARNILQQTLKSYGGMLDHAGEERDLCLSIIHEYGMKRNPDDPRRKS